MSKQYCNFAAYMAPVPAAPSATAMLPTVAVRYAFGIVSH